MSIKVKNLTHIYNENTVFEKKALDDISLEINNGEFIGIIGHTGSGKSTFIQHLNGLILPSFGEIDINGLKIKKDTKKFIDIRRKVAIVFQYPEYQLFEETVKKDIAFGPKNLGYNEQEIEKSIYDSIELIGLNEEILDKSPFELSGGQKKLVAIAGILAMKPEVLILDEPTSSLDPLTRNKVMNAIYNYHKSDKKNITIFVSHSMEDIANYADKIIVLDRAKLKYFDKKEVIFNYHKELKQIGLDIPNVSKIIFELNKNGFNINTNIYDIDLLVDEIYYQLKS